MLSVMAGVAVMASALFPGIISGSASGIPDVGGAGVFELDGNIAQDTATPPPYDWACVFPSAANANCPPPSSLMPDKVFQADYGNPDPTYFSSNGAGVKDINDINQWGCVALNNPLNKDDILNAYGAAFIVPHTSPYAVSKQGHVIVYLAQERDSNNGNSFAGFWLMKSQHSCDSAGAGTFSGVHDTGDLLVVSNYTNGGNTATVELWEWDPSNPAATNNMVQLGSGFTCGASSIPAGVADPNDMCAIANTGNVVEPWAPQHTLGANQFVEVGIDLSNLIPANLTNANSVCFSDFLAETRSSQELTATLKDYTTGRFHLCVNPTVTTQQTANNTTAAAQTILAGTAVSDQATLSGAILGTPQGTIQYKLFSGTACTGTPVYDSGALNIVNGVVPSSGSTTAANTVGTYEWQAYYSGDIALGGRNRPGTSTCGDEPLTVVDANITIAPQTATNAVGNQHTFTITVNAMAPSGTSVAFNSITTNVSPAPSSQSNTCASPTTSNGGLTASCTLTINSTTTTQYTADATAQLTIGGLSVTRTTASGGNHGPNGSGSATKNYVNAFITITPATAVNEVGNAHTFHITYTVIPAQGTTPSNVSFGAITTSVSPTTGLTQNSSTCGSPTVNGLVATCDLTINSTAYGTYTANASGSVTVDGATISRTTAPDGSQAGPGGSGPAVKHYVDASVAIGPNGINPVGQEHVFNIVVTAYPGGASPVSFVSITPSVTPTPGTMTTTCGSPTVTGPDGNGNYTATCTLTVDNSLANVFAANVTAQVSMGGVTVTRATNGNSGPGGSGPATKTYVDASVAIGPTAVNEVGHQHVFTVTVTAIPSGATPVLFSSITPSVSPTPDSMSSTCGTPTVNGDVATCTVTIDNNTAGTFTANATAVVSMGGTSVTRSTNSQVAPSGPGGSGPATKTYVDASVAIGPPTATNNVGAPHTFTITVTAIPSGATPVAFGAITPSVSPAPSTMSTTCGSPTINGNVATCTVTINSNVPGVFTANATASVTMGGVTVSRTTAPDGSLAGPGGSGPATKTYGQPSITIAPDAVNEVGHAHTFTVTVTSVPNTTTTFDSITTSVTPTPDSESTTCGSPTVNGNVATCTVTINNNSAGVFTATATAHLTVNGFATTVSTDGVAPNSGAATKTYVDANIVVTPQTAVNEVGNQHVFTVTTTVFPSEISPWSVDGITTSVTPTPDLADTSTCGSPVISGDTATCTVTINSSSSGTFTLNATADLIVDGVSLTRSTDAETAPAGPDGSGPAVKHYVDASVGIGPSAVNPINKEHTFDIVVTAYPSGASPVSFDSITTSVSPQPLTSSDTCADPTVTVNQDGTETATCTLTINNDLPNTFQANVTAQVTMGGVQVTRTTAAGGNAGPGGTGPATKTYVSANIGLSPLSADDPVGDLHTLTATVTTNNGSGEGQPQPAPDGTVVNFHIVSGPGTLASPTCTISNGLGTCTDVLTSNVQGTTVVQASVTLDVDTVTLTRTTGDSVPGDSQNAVKNWHKVQPSITTTQSAGGTVGTAVFDTATVSGGLNPSGTVTFQLFGPTDTTCSGTPVFISSNQPLSAGKATSGSFTPTQAGTYEWVATYNGDDANLTAVSKCGDEPVTLVIAAVQAITTPNTGAGVMSAMGEGLILVLAGIGVVAYGRRRRQG